jgi:hypothetical protein
MGLISSVLFCGSLKMKGVLLHVDIGRGTWQLGGSCLA